MKHLILKRITAALLTVTLTVSLVACRKSPSFSMDDFEDRRDTASITYTFSKTDDSDTLVYDEAALSDLQAAVMAQTVTYPYAELFNYEEAVGGIKSGLTVENHACSVLDENGEWTLEHFIELVNKNSAAYLAEQRGSILGPVDADIVHRICEIIMESITELLTRYPDIDRDRVYCNLGNLKVIKKGSALDFAAVEPGMVLHVNPSTSAMAGLFTGSNMHSVIVHESMHIVQYGCECEQIEGCARRCGLAYAYDSREQDYSDWIWLAEASAERMTCLLSNVEPMTYQTMVNYLLTLDLSVVLRDDVSANEIAQLNFHNDLDRLFRPFDADTEEEKREIYQMIYALEIMQMYPTDMKEAYQKLYGEEYTDEVHDRVCIAIKRPIVQTLTKRFYANLIDAIKKNTVTRNDVLFLLNLYDSTINYHLGFDNEKYNEPNKDFVAWYSDVQQAFFDAFENLFVEDYQQYQSHDEATNTIRAGMMWLDETKNTFLLEKFEDHCCNYKFIGEKAE